MYKSEKELIDSMKVAFENDINLPEKLIEANDLNEFKCLLKESRIELNDEEAELFFNERKNQMSTELDADALDNVAGGGILAGATIIGAGVAFVYGVYKSMKCRR